LFEAGGVFVWRTVWCPVGTEAFASISKLFSAKSGQMGGFGPNFAQKSGKYGGFRAKTGPDY